MQKLLISLMLLTASFSYAHSEAEMAAMVAPHGGQLKMVGWYHFELVSKGQQVNLYLSDHAGTPKPSKDVKGTVTVLDGTQKQEVTFTPLAPNQLRAQLSRKPSKNAQLEVKLTFPDGRSEQAQFDLQAPAKPAANHSQHH
ncbi:hypothetical protein HZU75_12500 [Chitinibacter fontanus]|uniref:Copper chaperone PCu(A)C n=1 Tax=Chitinibacter fontanus TaxID=1737446 RepID=A0A7D5VAU7_9NEIS|nr:hypothetical protein [Chitinibacter fontanus]QLI82278.1 hypothetical protein HZU75_12500 [Chitinibacter fontanus]